MVDISTRKSDSPRESIVHQIYVTRKYIYAIITNNLVFDGVTHKPIHGTHSWTKAQLLRELNTTTHELIEILTDPELASRKTKVPWANQPISALACVWGLNSHEILHTGWNLALMDHLNIPRFASLKAAWG